MNYTAKALLKGAGLAAMGMAMNAHALTFSGTSVWSFSPQLVEVVGLHVPYRGQTTEFIQVDAGAPASVALQHAYNPDFGTELLSRVDATVALTPSQTAPGVGNAPIQHTGSIMLSTPRALPQITLGGSLMISDLAIDMSNRRVYASITGNFSGVAQRKAAAMDDTSSTTIQNFYLFDYASAGPIFTPAVPGEFATFSLTGLTITQSGSDHIVSSLRLFGVGLSLLNNVVDYGSISTTITAVPEPSTYGLAVAGMVIVAAMKKKKSA
jgi:hypothetical protein